MKKQQMCHEFCLSLDLAKCSAQAAIAAMDARQEDWKKFATLAIDAAPQSREAIAQLTAWVADVTAPGAVCKRVVVESTSKISKRFARALKATKRFPPTIIVNPARSKAYLVSIGVRDKTDPIDAACLALYGARCDLSAPRELSQTEEKLRELNRLRETTIADRTKWENRLEEADDKDVRAHMRKTIDVMNKDVRKIDAEIRATLADEPVLSQQVQWLKKITGIKAVVATTLVAELGDLSCYSRGEIVSRAGLYAKKFISGTSVYRPARLACGGGGRVRRVLYMAATSLFNSKGALRLYIDENIEKGHKKMQIIGALMRKLLLIARAVVKADGQYRPEMIGGNKTACQGGSQMA